MLRCSAWFLATTHLCRWRKFSGGMASATKCMMVEEQKSPAQLPCRGPGPWGACAGWVGRRGRKKVGRVKEEKFPQSAIRRIQQLKKVSQPVRSGSSVKMQELAQPWNNNYNNHHCCQPRTFLPSKASIYPKPQADLTFIEITGFSSFGKYLIRLRWLIMQNISMDDLRHLCNNSI